MGNVCENIKSATLREAEEKYHELCLKYHSLKYQICPECNGDLNGNFSDVSLTLPLTIFYPNLSLKCSKCPFFRI